MNRCRVTLAVAVGFAAAHSALAQGPLNPPGAPAPTMKSLDQLDAKIDQNGAKLDQVTASQTAADAKLEKRIDILTLPGDNNATHIISQPGSYYAGGNVTAPGKTGISIRASNVTVDLNGFTLDGGGGAGAGIDVVGTRTNISVRNGVIRGWSGMGILHNSVSNGSYDRLHIADNASTGLTTGDHARITHCLIVNNGIAGISAGNRTAVLDTTVIDNIGNGIFLGSVSVVSRCIVRQNGLTGITLGIGGTVHDSTVFSNAGTFGISGGSGSTIGDCSVGFNGLASLSRPATTASVSAGISVGSGSTVVNCSSVTNGNSNATATGTTGMGIQAGEGSTVKNCTARDNKGDGIAVAGDCVVADNTSDSNGIAGNGSGIGVTGDDNRIDGNNVSDNSDFGIHVPASIGNLIIRNSASGNTSGNYVITAQNRFGPVVDLTGAQPSTVNGNTAGSTVGTTDPWANFAY